MHRRRFLRVSSTMGLVGLTGCSSQDIATETGTTPGYSQTTATPSSKSPYKTGGTESADSGTSTQAKDLALPWMQLNGPPGGPVTDIGVSQSNPNWMYATTLTAGVYVSSNKGSEWKQGLSGMHHRARIWVSPHNPKLAYTQERTNDGGRHWWDTRNPDKHRYPPIGGQIGVSDMAWDPFDSQTIYSTTVDGFYRTEDNGRTWERKEIELNEEFREVRKVAVHPEKEGVVFVGVHGQGVARTEDRGENWTMVTGSGRLPPNENHVIAIGLSDQASNELYLAFNGKGIYQISNGTVTELTESLPGLKFAFWGEAVSRSANGRHLYFVARHRSDGNWGPLQLHRYDFSSEENTVLQTPTEPSTVTAHPQDDDAVYLGGISWVHESTDRGATWRPLSNGFIDRYLATVGINRSRPRTVIVGSLCSTGITVSHDQGRSYDWKRSGLGPWHDGDFDEHYVMQIAAEGAYAYATTAAGLLLSRDNGDSWQLLNNEFSGYGDAKESDHGETNHLHGLAIEPGSPRTVYVGTGIGRDNSSRKYYAGTYIWKSQDSGDSWREITTGIPTDRDSVIQDILVDRHNSDIVYAGTNAEDYLAKGKGENAGVGLGVFRSTNAGRRWISLDSPFSNIHALTQDAEVPGRLFASTPQGVFRSDDRGSSWNLVLPNRTLALQSHPKVSGLLFAGTQKYQDYWDVLVSRDHGETWVGGNLTIQIGVDADARAYDAADIHSDYWNDKGQIMWFALDPKDSLLYAATQGTGLWRGKIAALEP